MPHVARLLALALIAACSASTDSATSDSMQGVPTPPPPPVTTDGRDWTRFNVDEARSGVFDAPTGISASALPTMRRQQVTLEGTVDAAPIYLHDVKVGGVGHD